MERFQMPSDEELIEMAIVVSEGEAEKEELANMVTFGRIILDRLYDSGDLKVPSEKEKRNGKN